MFNNNNLNNNKQNINNGIVPNKININNSDNNKNKVNNINKKEGNKSEICAEDADSGDLIMGLAIFNNSIVDYMLDTGAGVTVIGSQLYEKIVEECPGCKLEQYDNKLSSANSELKVKGLLRLERCMISTKLDLEDAKVVVVEDLKGLSCLVGRDWIGRIPHLKDTYKEQVELIQKMKKELQAALSKGQTFEKIKIGQEIMTVQESEDNKSIEEIKNEMERLRKELYED